MACTDTYFDHSRQRLAWAPPSGSSQGALARRQLAAPFPVFTNGTGRRLHRASRSPPCSRQIMTRPEEEEIDPVAAAHPVLPAPPRHSTRGGSSGRRT